MLTLYQLEGCPYCELVTDRLEELEIDYDSVWVEGCTRSATRSSASRASARSPVVVDEEYGVTMAESERILDYLETTHA